MNGATYFQLLAELMKTNPPAAADAPMVATMAKIGIVPGRILDPAKLNQAQSAAVQAAPQPAQGSIMGLLKEVALTNGWSVFTKLGVYGTEYRLRALITAIGLGANRPQDAIYPVAQMDADGKPFDGANRYAMHFPVDNFRRGRLLVVDDVRRPVFSRAEQAEPLHAERPHALKHNADGLVDLYLQASDPGAAKEANWLPTTQSGKFIPMLRLYWPKETPPSILDGTWKPPPIQKVTAP